MAKLWSQCKTNNGLCLSSPAHVTNKSAASSYRRGGVSMRNVLIWVLGIGLAINGLAMLAAPAQWYMAVPGVAETGPFNPHFVRDIGAAYFGAGASLLWFAVQPAALAAAQLGAAFLALHALIHLWDTAAGRE